jgi:hypothetical protein
MSHFRASDVWTDRPEGGRHGRTGNRSVPPGSHPVPSAPHRPRSVPLPSEARIGPQLLRAAMLPTAVAALSGTAAVAFVIHSAGVHPSAALRGVLAACAALALAAVACAALSADRVARNLLDRCDALRRSIAHHRADLRSVVDRLRRGEVPLARRSSPTTAAGGDVLDLLAQEAGRAQQDAVAAVVQASQLSRSVVDEQKVEVFVNLARRLQSLVHREIQLLDELENQVEDPELLKGLFHVDHLTTRIRRHAENLAVLGGAISRRQWSNPVPLTEVMRSAIAEVEQYQRVALVPPIDGTLRGHAVADVIHLLAELVENATVFSSSQTRVLLRAQHVTSGLAVEVEDRGRGMPVTENDKMNALLADPDQVNVGHLLQNGRIGLYVVGALARRHGIAVRLQTNIYGGVQAVLVLPAGLLGTDENGLRSAPPASLPVRETQGERPRPSVSFPGARHGFQGAGPTAVDDALSHERVPHDAGPFPALSPQHSPELPRRRRQQHLVPQLKDIPAPRSDDEHPAVHDPGLVAAFQRGISLAEAQPGREPPGDGQFDGQQCDDDTFKE